MSNSSDSPYTSSSSLPVLGRLVCMRDNTKRIVEIDQLECIIGRSIESNVVLDRIECSKRHCRLFVLSEPSQSISSNDDDLPKIIWMVEDLSTNGTFVNGKSLPKNHPVPLYNADVIEIKPGFHFEFLSEYANFPNANHELNDPDFDKISNRYLLTRKLGCGTYANVYLAQNLESGRRYACKVVNKKKAGISSHVLDGTRIPEIEVIRHFNHPNIVRVHDYTDTSKYLYVFMDLALSGELFEYLARERGLEEGKCKVIMFQVFKGLTALHSKKVVHRDIKPENILLQWVNEYPRILLADFGLAKRESTIELKSCTTLCGTLSYLAPEVLTDTRNSGYGPAVDCWAAGVMLYFLLSCRLPFEDPNDSRIKERIKTCDYIFEAPCINGGNLFDKISTEVKDLIHKLLQQDPSQRLTASEALKHSWFQKDKADLKAIYLTLYKQWLETKTPTESLTISTPITESQLFTQQEVPNDVVTVNDAAQTVDFGFGSDEETLQEQHVSQLPGTFAASQSQGGIGTVGNVETNDPSYEFISQSQPILSLSQEYPGSKSLATPISLSQGSEFPPLSHSFKSIRQISSSSALRSLNRGESNVRHRPY